MECIQFNNIQLAKVDSPFCKFGHIIYCTISLVVINIFTVDMSNRCLLCGRAETSINLAAYNDWVMGITIMHKYNYIMHMYSYCRSNVMYAQDGYTSFVLT